MLGMLPMVPPKEPKCSHAITNDFTVTRFYIKLN